MIVACLGEYDSKALRYAILKLNTAQSFVEYEIVYDVPEEHDFVARRRYGGVVRTSYIKQAVSSFEAEVVHQQSAPFKNAPQTPCDRYLALCNCQLESGVYLFKPGDKIRTSDPALPGLKGCYSFYDGRRLRFLPQSGAI